VEPRRGVDARCATQLLARTKYAAAPARPDPLADGPDEGRSPVALRFLLPSARSSCAGVANGETFTPYPPAGLPVKPGETSAEEEEPVRVRREEAGTRPAWSRELDEPEREREARLASEDAARRKAKGKADGGGARAGGSEEGETSEVTERVCAETEENAAWEGEVDKEEEAKVELRAVALASLTLAPSSRSLTVFLVATEWSSGCEPVASAVDLWLNEHLIV
jgi:hypothetical protein